MVQTVSPFRHKETDQLLYPLYMERESSYPGMENLYRFAGYVAANYVPAKDEFMGKPDEWIGGAFSIGEVHSCHIFKKGTVQSCASHLTPEALVVGGRYNWQNQPDRLIYLGRSMGGTGGWHQFRKIGDPRPVWCEVLSKDLHMLEETKEPTNG